MDQWLRRVRTTDAGADGSPVVSCVGVADGTPCNSASDICVDGACAASTCGDGYVHAARGEECQDGNDTAFDGCEPSTTSAQGARAESARRTSSVPSTERGAAPPARASTRARGRCSARDRGGATRAGAAAACAPARRSARGTPRRRARRTGMGSCAAAAGSAGPAGRGPCARVTAAAGPEPATAAEPRRSARPAGAPTMFVDSGSDLEPARDDGRMTTEPIPELMGTLARARIEPRTRTSTPPSTAPAPTADRGDVIALLSSSRDTCSGGLSPRPPHGLAGTAGAVLAWERVMAGMRRAIAILWVGALACSEQGLMGLDAGADGGRTPDARQMLGRDAASARDAGSDAGAAPLELVTVRGDRLFAGDEQYAARGANYYGARYLRYVSDAAGREHYNPDQIFRDFDEAGIAADLRTLRCRLGVRQVRVFTPTWGAFERYVLYHGWDPWFASDGSITPLYRERLVRLLRLAAAQGMRVQLVLLLHVHLWAPTPAGVPHVLASTEWRVPVGSAEEAFYIRYVQSVAEALRGEPGLLAYEISNETLLRSPDNYWAPSGYESRVLSFTRRLIEAVRAADDTHLITSGEVITPPIEPYASAWHAPSPELGVLEDVDGLNDGRPYSLASLVDYLSPHLYVATDQVRPAAARLAERTELPIVLGEAGYTDALPFADKSTFARAQAEHWSEIVAALDESSISGVQPWSALPMFPTAPGSFTATDAGDGTYLLRLMTRPPREILFYDDRWELLAWDLTPLPAGSVLAGAFGAADCR
ncbi:MAG: cellulase family glycosylhydrolase [Sandaracinaceae bacterium]|nr:cellulase family glycosylhydrolase [Sandaracinaceae bacterium]